MIDTRTYEIYLVPALHRSEVRGIAGQVPWHIADLKNEWFYRNRHLAVGNTAPYSATKLRNLDHGRAAYYLEGIETPYSKDIDAFQVWLELQYVSSNWLGFFVHKDSQSGKMVLNFKSAQLNFPNLNAYNHNLGDIFLLDKNGRVDFSFYYDDSTKIQQQDKTTQLPGNIKLLAISAMAKL